jgi:hypothetical protein
MNEDQVEHTRVVYRDVYSGGKLLGRMSDLFGE